jgi:hypothetical protein
MDLIIGLEGIDAALFRALDISQGNFEQFFEITETLNQFDKIKLIIATGECGYSFDLEGDDPKGLDIDIYDVDTMHSRDTADILGFVGFYILTGRIQDRFLNCRSYS